MPLPQSLNELSQLAHPSQFDALVSESGSQWLGMQLQTVHRLQQLQPGWDGYDAEPPNSKAVGLARLVLIMLVESDAEPTRVDPSVEGGICISFIRGNRYGDIECFNTGELLAATSDGKSEPSVWTVTPDRDGIAAAASAIKSHFI